MKLALKYLFITVFLVSSVAAQTSITIDAGSTIKDVSHRPVGINMNYLIDDDAYLNPSTPTESALKNMGVKFLRYPGGEKSDNYLWSVSPFTRADPHFALKGNCSWPNTDPRFSDDQLTPKSTTLDFDEFMVVCQNIGAEPLIVVAGDAHYYNDDGCGLYITLDEIVENASEWVRYANVINNYNIKYWMIGNESWNLAAYDDPPTASQYTNDFVAIASAMKSVDPTIKVVANSQEGSWANTLLSNSDAIANLDVIAISNYPINGWSKGYDNYRKSTPNFVSKLTSVIRSINNHAPESGIKVMASEYSPIDWSGSWENSNDLGHALVAFQMIGDMLEIPELDNAYFWNTRWVYESWPIFNALDFDGNMNAVGLAISVWGNHLLDELVSSSETRSIRSFSSKDKTGKLLNIFLINKETSSKNVVAQVSNFSDINQASISTYEFTGTSVEDDNPTFQQVSDLMTSTTANSISLTLSPLSVSVISIDSAGGTPVLSFPADQSIEQATTLTLGWREVQSISSYQVQVSTTSDFSNLIVDETAISSTSLEITELNTCTTYYWRVRAANAAGTSDWSDGWSFTTVIVVPAATTLVSPIDGETGVEINPTLAWNTSFCTDSYHLQIATDSDFSTVVMNQDSVMDTSFPVSGLSNYTTYYWRVNATNSAGTSDWSSVRSFTTIPAVPAAPALVSPADGETGVQINPILTWHAASGASSYQLQVSTSPSFSDPFLVQDKITETSFTVSGLLNNTRYYWRVNAMNEGGTSDWSTIWQFTTIVAPPAAPILNSPPDSATGISVNPTLVWNPSDGASSYRLQVATISDFVTTIIDESAITTNSFQATGLENSTQYFWRINATNEGGTSDWSTVWSFVTDFPTSVEQISREIPNNFKLGQNYPNPFNPTTTIDFDLPKAGFVTLKVYNTIGQEVVTLVSKSLQAGKYSAVLNASNLATGAYLYKLQFGSLLQIKKMTLVR